MGNTPEEKVKDAVLDALANEYEWEQILTWVDDAVSDYESATGTETTDE